MTEIRRGRLGPWHDVSGNLHVGPIGPLLLLLLATGPATAVAAETTTRPATVKVHPASVIGPVNRAVLGNNMLAYQGKDVYSSYGAGIWDPSRRRPEPAMVELCKQTGAASLRWPGGCAAHRYNWKKTVGALSSRPDQPFGLPEFLAFCEAAGAKPVLTLAVYWGGPEDGADLVEYLNAPYDGLNPNGGVDWADVRAGDGHPEPYNVRWIEFGNESDHGDHKGTKFTAQEYARRYTEYRRRMRAVDPKIKLGAVLSTGGLFDRWNNPLLAAIGREVDFVVHHPYTPAYYRNDEKDPHAKIAHLCMAAAGRRQLWLVKIRRMLRDRTGRDDVPVALTEYNGHFVQEKPVRFRQCLANAVNNADAIRLMLQPRYSVVMANFWQFSNEYWGMVRGHPHENQRLVKQANYLVFELINRHLGAELIASEVQCDRFSHAGGTGVVACDDRTFAKGRSVQDAPVDPDNATLAGLADRLCDLGTVAQISLRKPLGPIDPPAEPWAVGQAEGVEQEIHDGVLRVAFAGGKDINYYHAKKTLPAKPRTGYRVKIQVRTIDLKGGNAGIQVGDARGWIVTRSCAVVAPLTGTTEWTAVVAEYVTLTDTTEIEIMARRLSGDGPVSGRAEFGKIEVEAFQPECVSTLPELTALASQSPGPPAVIHLVLICKRLGKPLPVRIARPDGFRLTRAECLSGPAPWSTNLDKPDVVKIAPLPAIDAPSITATLPPCSLAGLRFEAVK